jgi:hypothetical protein
MIHPSRHPSRQQVRLFAQPNQQFSFARVAKDIRELPIMMAALLLLIGAALSAWFCWPCIKWVIGTDWVWPGWDLGMLVLQSASPCCGW